MSSSLPRSQPHHSGHIADTAPTSPNDKECESLSTSLPSTQPLFSGLALMSPQETVSVDQELTLSSSQPPSSSPAISGPTLSTTLPSSRRSASSTHNPTMCSSAARVDPQGTTPGTLAAASSDAISPRSSRVAPVTPEVYTLQKSSGQFSEKSSGLPLEKSSGLLSEKCSGACVTEFGNNTLLSPPAVVGSARNFLGPSSCSSSVELFNNIGHGGGRQAEVT